MSADHDSGLDQGKPSIRQSAGWRPRPAANPPANGETAPQLLASAPSIRPAATATTNVWTRALTLVGIKHPQNAKTVAKRNVTLRGEVRGFRDDTEGSGIVHVWRFRVESFQDTQRQPPVAVEMRSSNFNGFINEGDTVEIYDVWKDREAVQPKELYNVTNRVTVSVHKPSLFERGCRIFVVTMIVIIFVFVIGVFISPLFAIAFGWGM